MLSSPLIPAKAGTQVFSTPPARRWPGVRSDSRPRRDHSGVTALAAAKKTWVPAFAGMSGGKKAVFATLAAAALSLAASAAFAQGNPVKGKQVYDDNCSGCHVLTGQGFGGPPLAGVYGLKAGTAPGFAYSDAMKKSGVVWDETSLREFLADPSKTVPGTSMVFNLSDPQQRDDVIAYLRSLSSPSH